MANPPLSPRCPAVPSSFSTQAEHGGGAALVVSWDGAVGFRLPLRGKCTGDDLVVQLNGEVVPGCRRVRVGLGAWAWAWRLGQG